MNKKVFITQRVPEIGGKILKERGYEVDVFAEDRVPTHEEIIKCLGAQSYDAAIVMLTDRIDASIFKAAPTIKLYVSYATGYNNIDVAEARARGITVANSPSISSSEAVARYTLALITSLASRIVESDRFVRQGKFQGWAPMRFIGTDLDGKILGLVGTGRIGERVALHAGRMGMRIAYTDLVRNPQIEKNLQAIYYDSVEELVANADVVSLHVPLRDSTRHLLSEARLRMMKPDSLLINTSRGAVIDEKALEDVLAEKAIKGAALDVFEYEPTVSEELLKLDNVILTPHIASASENARNQMTEIAAGNIIDFFEGRQPRNKIEI